MRAPIELLTLLYVVTYVPYAVLTHWLSATPGSSGKAMSGLELLPATLVMGGLLTLAFISLCGWARLAGRHFVGGLSIPLPTGWTALSGLGASLILFTVPLSFTFRDVSIPFMQLLMRGDVLVIAPCVDWLMGKRVRWYSWVALFLVAGGLTLTIHARGGLHLSPLAIATVCLYTFGYFVRLLAMSRVGKRSTGKPAQAYFVEEKLVAYPLAIVGVVLLSVLGSGSQAGELMYGFVGVWGNGQVGILAVVSILIVMLSVFSLLILLQDRENTFCVAFERSGSILAGIIAAYLLSAMSLGPPPAVAELEGALLLVIAVVLLSVAPRWEAIRAGAGDARIQER
jgi:hypothetical protein